MVHLENNNDEDEICVKLFEFYLKIDFSRYSKKISLIVVIVAAIKLFWSLFNSIEADIYVNIIGLVAGIGYIYSYFKLRNLIYNLRTYYNKNRCAAIVVNKMCDKSPIIGEEIKRIISAETLD